MAGTVLLLVEFQRQWTDPGLYRRLLEPDLSRRRVIEATASLADHARAHGAPVVHAPLVVDPENLQGTFGRLTRGVVFTKNHRRSQLDPEVYREGDVVVTGRTGFDAFTGSDLYASLNRLDAERVLIGGFATDQCVLKTWRTAMRKGYDAFAVADCTATFSAWWQQRTLRPLGSRAVTGEQARLLVGL